MSRGFKALVFLGIEPMERVFDIERYLERLDNVLRIYEVTGEFELFVELIIDDSKELGMIINKISTLKGVKNIQTFVVTKEIKDYSINNYTCSLRGKR
ncbi:MAG: Lrp/AsnC ligand binding domain-containing protein [Euryarchaeota archaeon]|nr:Lrp/AsnC ligand binding domain-containing protein [Euryarchaeota archaeon]